MEQADLPIINQVCVKLVNYYNRLGEGTISPTIFVLF